MTASRRLLIYGGIALVLWAMAYGLVYAVFVEHQALDRMGGSLTEALVAWSQRSPDRAETSLRAYAVASYVYVRHVDAHSHWSGLAILLLLFGLAIDNVGFSERVRIALAAALVAGSVTFPLGVLLQTLDSPDVGQLLAIFGSGLVTIGLLVAVVGLTRTSSAEN